MRAFYALPPLRVVFAKAERDAIRDKAKKGTIAAKMFFKGLDYGAVAAHYAADLG